MEASKGLNLQFCLFVCLKNLGNVWQNVNLCEIWIECTQMSVILLFILSIFPMKEKKKKKKKEKTTGAQAPGPAQPSEAWVEGCPGRVVRQNLA